MAKFISSMGSSRFCVELKDRVRWASAWRRAASFSRCCILAEARFYNMIRIEKIRPADAEVSRETAAMK